MTDHTPPSDARTDSTATDRSDAGPESRIAVLQVEPDGGSAELLRAFARRRFDRVRVRSVDRSADALDAVEAGVHVDGERVAVDCVVTELRLSDGTGVDLIERLREAAPETPVVVHTTRPSEECEAAALGAGADAYFEKGADCGRFGVIFDRIRALVDGRRGGGNGADRTPASTPRTPDAAGETLRSEE